MCSTRHLEADELVPPLLYLVLRLGSSSESLAGICISENVQPERQYDIEGVCNEKITIDAPQLAMFFFSHMLDRPQAGSRMNQLLLKTEI